MNPEARQHRDATECEILELEQLARDEHVSVGLQSPSETMIQIRVRDLAEEKGLRLPGSFGSRESVAKRPSRVRAPNYLEAGLEQQGQQCAKNRRAARQEKHVRIVRRNRDRFYLFCFLKGGFARAMSDCRALEVFAALVEQLGGNIETWVSIETLADRLGRTPKTVSKALRKLDAKRIITMAAAASQDCSLHGKPIRKKQGYIFQLHAPMFWDWESIGGVPGHMKKYLADYKDEPVDNLETPVTVTGVPR